jgi:hypothetical protein
LASLIQPALQAHVPSVPHSPFTQLQVAGLLSIEGTKHWPDPDIPWSHVWHCEGQGWQVGPKNPLAQTSQEGPVKPGGQLHFPEVEQTAEPEHAGEQAYDWISTRARDWDAADGSWETSGTACQNIILLLFEPEVRAIQTFLESAKELAGSGREVFMWVEGRGENDACPA